MISDCLVCNTQYYITMFSTLNGIHSVNLSVGQYDWEIDLRVVGHSPDMYWPQAVWILFSNAVYRLPTSLSRSPAQIARFTRSASLRNCDNLVSSAIYCVQPIVSTWKNETDD